MSPELAQSVTIDEIIFQSADARFTVARATEERSERAIVIVGELGAVARGETLSVRGRFEQHASYGQRFVVESFTPITPRTSEGIRRYLGSGLVPGVGPALAERIVQRFGERTLEVISTQSARLREVSGIGATRVNRIAEAVRSRTAEAEALSYAQSLGLGPALARRIRKRYGDDSVRVLRDDPYLVAEQVAGVGFRTADRIGRALGYDADDPRRASGAALHLVGLGADAGHAALRMPELIEQARALDIPELPLRDAVAALNARGLLCVEDEAVYAAPLYRAEVDAAQRLSDLARPRTRPSAAKRALESAYAQKLSPDQRRAVELSLEYGLFVLTGGPGTGKTTTVRALCDAHLALGRRVRLCAPTGRAAKRLAEATSMDAQTIHRLLEYNPATAAFARDTDSPLEADLVLCDEASMIDLMLGDQLLRALPKGCALILVGDIDQLPPVGAGALLRALLNSEICPVARLTEVFRQAQRSAIVRAAHAIQHGQMPASTPPSERGEGDLFVIRARDPELITQRVLDALARMHAAYGLDPERDVQVLTPMRKGPLGTERLNERLQAALNPAPEHQAGLRFRPGDKVMQLRNDYDRDVFNGDLGRVAGVTPEQIVIDVQGRKISYDRDAQDALGLAYASTIHKVQGSEFPAVIIVLHTTHHVLLSRALLYTAVTRAKRLALIIGDERALSRAIANTAERRVFSRLEARLRAAAALPA